MPLEAPNVLRAPEERAARADCRSLTAGAVLSLEFESPLAKVKRIDN